MNTLTKLLPIMAISILIGCSEQAPDDRSQANDSSIIKDEITKLGEIPAVLSEGLTPEEQAELKEQIMPPGVGDTELAEKKFQALLEDARAGDPSAQNGLGVMYYTGEAVSKTPSGQILPNDPELAAGWFFRAAEQGYADAQFNLGLMYVNGEGVEKDLAHAVELFKKAAEQGHVDAQNNLGAMYFTGEGVKRDEQKAISWFEKAAAQGNADAQANLDAIKAAKK